MTEIKKNAGFPRKPNVEDFVKGGGAETKPLAAPRAPAATKRKATPAPPPLVPDKQLTYLLKIPESMREEIRIEAIKVKLNMSDYICGILVRRKELK